MPRAAITASADPPSLHLLLRKLLSTKLRERRATPRPRRLSRAISPSRSAPAFGFLKPCCIGVRVKQQGAKRRPMRNNHGTEGAVSECILEGACPEGSRAAGASARRCKRRGFRRGGRTSRERRR